MNHLNLMLATMCGLGTMMGCGAAPTEPEHPTSNSSGKAEAVAPAPPSEGYGVLRAPGPNPNPGYVSRTQRQPQVMPRCTDGTSYDDALDAYQVLIHNTGADGAEVYECNANCKPVCDWASQQEP